jgi:hypothetical protein
MHPETTLLSFSWLILQKKIPPVLTKITLMNEEGHNFGDLASLSRGDFNGREMACYVA